MSITVRQTPLQQTEEPIIKYREVTFLVKGRYEKKKVPLDYLRYEQKKMSGLMDNFEKKRLELENYRKKIGDRRYEIFQKYMEENQELVFH